MLMQPLHPKLKAHLRLILLTFPPAPGYMSMKQVIFELQASNNYERSVCFSQSAYDFQCKNLLVLTIRELNIGLVFFF